MNAFYQYHREHPGLASIAWRAALVLSVILLGLWIGKSSSADSLLSPAVLLAVGLPLVIAGPYLAHGFLRTLTAFDYALPLGLLIPMTALYLGIQATWQDLERSLLWGEIFALLLLPAIGSVRYRHPGQRQIIHAVYYALFVLPVYGVLYTWFYWRDEYQTYFLLRHLAVFHYIVFFFVAYAHAERFLAIFAKFFWVPLLFIIPGVLQIPVLSEPYFSFGLIGVPILLAWCTMGYLRRARSVGASLAGLLIYLILLGLLSLRSTNVAVMAAVTGLLPAIVLVRYWHRLVPSRARRFALAGLVALFVTAGGYILYFVGHEIQDNISYQIDIMSIPEQAGVQLGELQDTARLGSLMYRVSLWSQFFIRFVENPFGVGLGTAVFEERLIKAMALGTDLNPDLSYQTYTIGAHNSFFTFLARFGLVFLVPFALCTLAVVRMISAYCGACGYAPLAASGSRVVFGGILVFSVAMVEAMFNMVVETPLYAAVFWFSFGMMVRPLGDYLAEARQFEWNERPS